MLSLKRCLEVRTCVLFVNLASTVLSGSRGPEIKWSVRTLSLRLVVKSSITFCFASNLFSFHYRMTKFCCVMTLSSYVALVMCG